MDIQDKDLSIEQKIVRHLVDIGIITKMGDASRALKSLKHAQWLINTKLTDKENAQPIPPTPDNPDTPIVPDTSANQPGIVDDIKDAIQKGEIKVDGLECTECDHEALTNEEIQQIFDAHKNCTDCEHEDIAQEDVKNMF